MEDPLEYKNFKEYISNLINGNYARHFEKQLSELLRPFKIEVLSPVIPIGVHAIIIHQLMLKFEFPLLVNEKFIKELRHNSFKNNWLFDQLSSF